MDVALVGLVDDPNTTLEDKLQRLRALHSKWQYEDKKEVVNRIELVFQQKTRCKDIESIVFGFTLYEG